MCFSWQPIRELCQRIRFVNRQRQHRILLHTDAAQAIGKVRVDARDLGVDYLTVVGHKVRILLDFRRILNVFPWFLMFFLKAYWRRGRNLRFFPPMHFEKEWRCKESRKYNFRFTHGYCDCLLLYSGKISYYYWVLRSFLFPHCGFQFYAPRIGALYVNGPGTTTPLYPMLFGGGQERNFRPGYRSSNYVYFPNGTLFPM